jgi:bifunctional non-homologous end joining protein LigD
MLLRCGLGLDVQFAVLPRIQPMRLTRIAKAFDDPDYVVELKHDGFRAIAYIEAGECMLVSHNLKHFKSFESLRRSLDRLPVQNAILDGEVVCLDSNGVSQFNELMSRKGKPVFYAFDLLWLNGDDLRSLPLIERKRRLHELVQRSQSHAIIYAQHIEDRGIGLFQEICARDLEGIVAKRKRGVYKNNGVGWKKIKNPKYSQAEGRHDLFKRGR